MPDRPRPSRHPSTHGLLGIVISVGHAATAAATFAAVALLVGRGRSRRTKALLAAGAAAIAVGLRRLAFSSACTGSPIVLAGLAMGGAWFAISSIAFDGRVLRFGRPVEVAQHAVERAADTQSDREAVGGTV